MKRTLSLGVVWIFLAAVAISETLIGIRLLTGSDTLRYSAESDVLSAGGLVVALVAGTIAIATYRSATGKAKLYMQVGVRGQVPVRAILHRDHSIPPSIVLDLEGPESGKFRRIQGGTPQLRLWLGNDSKRYLARNPSVLIEFIGIVGVTALGEWVPVAPDDGQHAFLWDGGADRAIPAMWKRPLPLIDFRHARAIQPTPIVHLWIIAEGCLTGRLEIEFSDRPRASA